MKDRKLNKKNLIIEEIFYIFILIYGALFLIVFTKSAYENNMLFGISIGVVSVIAIVMYLWFVIFRLKVILTKDVIYEEDIEFFKMFKLKKKSSDKVPVEGVVSDEKFAELDKDKDGRIMVNEFYPKSEEEIIELLVKQDEKFSKTLFSEVVYYIYQMYEESINKLDSSIIRPFMTDAMFFQHNLLINDYSNSKNKEVRQNVRVKGMLLKNFKVEGNKEILEVALTSKMKKYSTDEDGRVVDGDQFDYVDVPYILTFVRKVGVVTDNVHNIENCPNCGAVIKINDDGVCDYCNTNVVSGEFGWVLSDIKCIDI